jgi:hypothetical protein
MPYEQKLENNLLLRTVRNEQDIANYVAFNTIYNNANEGLNTDLLIRHFPGASFDDYQLVEDEHSGEIAATTCLIPWVFEFEGIPLRAAQLEQVLSHPNYRRHGLVKIQMKRFMDVVREREFDFSFIWGIPYYYRQYGYSYCIDGSVFESLPAWRIPESSQASGYSLRSASLADVAALTALYDLSRQDLQLSVTRSGEHWKYLLEKAKFPLRIVEEQHSGRAVGYVGLVRNPDATGVTIIESGISNQDVGMAVLRALKAETGGEIRVCWPQQSTLAVLASTLGSVTRPAEQWLLNITDMVRFMTRIGPVLERRLAGSDCAGLTRDLTINLFRKAYRLSFKAGSLHGVEALGFVDSSMGADGGDVCIPPDAFVRLVFGYRGLSELFDAWPDIVVKVESRHLLEVLFPRMTSYFYSLYTNFF